MRGEEGGGRGERANPSRRAGCGRRRRRRLASANRGERGEVHGERDGCGRRAGGALPQEGQQKGKDAGRVPREFGGQETPAGPAWHPGQRDGGRHGLRDQRQRDRRRFGSVSGKSADADFAIERHATRHPTACGVAIVVDRTHPCTGAATGEPRTIRGERGAPRVERGVVTDSRFDGHNPRFGREFRRAHRVVIREAGATAHRSVGRGPRHFDPTDGPASTARFDGIGRTTRCGEP